MYSIESEIVYKMIISEKEFIIKGRSVREAAANLKKHVKSRAQTVKLTKLYKIPFSTKESGGDVNSYVSRLKKRKSLKDKEELFKEIQEDKSLGFACKNAVTLILYAGSDTSAKLQERDYEQTHIPGDWLYIRNTLHNGQKGLEGENIIYLGKGKYWGVMGNGSVIQTFGEWENTVAAWGASLPVSPIRYTRAGLS